VRFSIITESEAILTTRKRTPSWGPTAAVASTWRASRKQAAPCHRNPVVGQWQQRHPLQGFSVAGRRAQRPEKLADAAYDHRPDGAAPSFALHIRGTNRKMTGSRTAGSERGGHPAGASTPTCSWRQYRQGSLSSPDSARARARRPQDRLAARSWTTVLRHPQRVAWPTARTTPGRTVKNIDRRKHRLEEGLRPGLRHLPAAAGSGRESSSSSRPSTRRPAGLGTAYAKCLKQGPQAMCWSITVPPQGTIIRADRRLPAGRERLGGFT